MKHNSIGLIYILCAIFAFSANSCSNSAKEAGVSLLLTDVTRTYDLTADTIRFDEPQADSSLVICLDTAQRFQTIDGFGAAITGSTAYNLSLMPSDKRKQFLEETFSPDKYGYSYVRVSIGCSDFSLSDYTCCDKKGIENFALTAEETKYVIPALKEILAINPEVKIMGTPWTAPKWMKVDNLKNKRPHDSWTGGHLNPNYYQDYATYFVKWIQAFQAEGITIYSLTPQNEPLNPGNSASMLMFWNEERDFVKTALGPALKEAGLDNVKIYAFDHNYNYDDKEDQAQYPLRIYEDAESAAYFTGAAYHNYGGHRSEMQKIHEAAPDKELIFSEASIGEWNNGRDLSKSLLRDVEDLAIGTVNNWCVGAIVWNLMLDSDKGPHGGPGACATCYGAVDVDNKDYSTITRNSHYYAMAHIAAVVKPGAVRIGTNAVTKEKISYCSFKNTDGSYALVVANGNDTKQPITVVEGNHQFNYTIPANAVASFRWQEQR